MIRLFALALSILAAAVPARAEEGIIAPAANAVDKMPAKKLFGTQKVPANLRARAIGTYARGCLAGAVSIPVDGPAWQAMRLSRNRNWGHPRLIALVERLAMEAKANDG